MAGRSKRPGALYPLALLLILLVVATLSRRIPGLEGSRRVVQARAVDITALGSGDTREILQRLQAVHLVPAEATATGAPGRREGGSQTFSLDPIPPERLPEVLRIDPKWLARGVPVVVLMMEVADLEELHDNALARGRQWERPAFFAYLENGELRFTTTVGVRIHGGWSRAQRGLRSFRIYFRNRYGIDHFPLALLPTGGRHAARVLIVRNDHSVDSNGRPWPLVSPLAYDLARGIGAAAPRTKPVMLYVNGERLGMQQLVERVDRDYLLAHFGHDEFVLARTESLMLSDAELKLGLPVPAVDKVKVGPPVVYEEFRRWAEGYTDLDLEAISARVDIDNLSRWLLANLYCANLDPFQGSLLLDLQQPEAKWFWLLWDFDGSFLRFGPWRSTLKWTLDDPFRNRPRDERSLLLNHLIRTSHAYRDYLAGLFVETMNHRMTTAFVVSTIRRYRRTAATFEVPDDDLDHIEKFLLRQPRKLARVLRRALHQGPIRRVSVRAPANRAVVIDGYPSGSDFAGLYFSGMSMQLAIADSDRQAFSHWEMGSQVFAEAALGLEIDSDMAIRAVFEESPGRTDL